MENPVCLPVKSYAAITAAYTPIQQPLESSPKRYCVVKDGNDQYGIIHILKRHGLHHLDNGLSQFCFSDRESLKRLLDEGLKNRDVQLSSRGDHQELLVDFKRYIGLDKYGCNTSKAVIGINADTHVLLTAYPVEMNYKA